MNNLPKKQTISISVKEPQASNRVKIMQKKARTQFPGCMFTPIFILNNQYLNFTLAGEGYFSETTTVLPRFLPSKSTD